MLSRLKKQLSFSQHQAQFV